MEPIIKETQVIRDHGGWEGNTRAKSNWALGLGIFGAAAGATALARQGGIGGILGGTAPANTVVYNNPSSPCCPVNAFAKECDDVLALTKSMYDLYIVGQQNASKARETDVAEKFGLYINNRNSIDALSERVNAAFFDQYKYTRDKDDETNAKIYDLAQQVAINTAVRPYQDKLIQCKIDEVYTALVNYVDRKTCRMIEGVNTLPLTPEVTGVLSQNCCNQQLLAALAGGGAA